ncbi:MAG: nitrile hydratase activator [Pseudomonadota bacterium]
MQTTDHHFVASRILASLDRPVHNEDSDDEALSQLDDWKQRAIGVALALSRDGHFEWEDFRQALLQHLGGYQVAGDASWGYSQRWLLALESVVGTAGLVDAGALAELRGLAERAELGRSAHPTAGTRPASLHLL